MLREDNKFGMHAALSRHGAPKGLYPWARIIPRLLWYHYTRLSPIITRAQSFLPSARLAATASVTGPVRFNERDRARKARR